jgi:bifunctional non-homologous end joining protein LigD
VVQKHAASHVHFDLRLEIGGVYHSWAVPRGPSVNPLDQRMAVQVEDHPLEYGKFEGVIPKGNYGAGTVMIWDTGTYTERSSQNRSESEKAMEKGLRDGKLTVVLSGHRLKGEFALVRLKNRGQGGKPAWLLIKKRDEHAVFRPQGDARDAEDRSAVSGRTMREIAEEKKAVWVPKREAKKTAKAEMPHRILAQQATIGGAIENEKDWLWEPYRAGVRAVAEVEGKQVKLYSRTRLPLEGKYPEIVSALRKLGHHAVVDGDIIDGKYLLSDLLYLDGRDLRETGLVDRKKKLASLKLKEPLVLAEVSDEPPTEGWAVAKKRDSHYQGGVARDWVRLRMGSKARATVVVADRPPLTNPQKIFWPKEKITKGDLFAYYQSIGSVILPHLVDRPQSLHRQPDGLKNEGFFQKDMVGYLPRRIARQRVSSRSANKTVDYLLCQDEWTLLYMINLGCIELNPWLSRKDSLERPDYLVIDLDPDDNKFSEVIEVARETHRLLEKIEVPSFCKTSGSSGLHICVPLGARYDYDAARIFAEAVCTELHLRMPDNTSIERNPARRRGKIYLDFLQNRRGQTLAAPYCVRPRPGATVSAPLKWNEVKRGLEPTDFTLRNMKQRVDKLGDLWKPLGESKAANLPAAHRQLSRLRHGSKR